MQHFKIYTRAVILDNEKRNVLLIKKQQDQKFGGGEWLLPGGTVEFGEDIELSLIREIHEETNLSVVSLALLTSKKMIIGNTHWLGIYFIAKVKDKSKLINAEKHKHETVKFMPLNSVPDFRDYMMLPLMKNIASNCEYVHVLPAIAQEHSMEHALQNYLHKKIHNLVRINHDMFDRVKVVGNYDRSIHVSKDEKNDKLFNYKRPTACIDGGTLYLCCFPGGDYIYHYAKLMSSYFHHIGIKKQVSYLLADDTAIHNTFLETNIHQIPEAEIIIFGNIDKIGIFSDQEFSGNGDFMWKTGVLNGKKVVLLGCTFSIWGDTGFHLIEVLVKTHPFSVFIYIGKLGVLDPQIPPNQYLATGSKSFVEGECVEWDNVFSESITHSSVILGEHITCPSVIDETKTYIKEVCKYGNMIDPEIGQMAKACNKNGKQFSYLHIISDNVVAPYEENLSNERKGSIREKRKALFLAIGEIIQHTSF